MPPAEFIFWFRGRLLCSYTSKDNVFYSYKARVFYKREMYSYIYII